MTMETDVKNSRYYLNRELSWLQFNKRVLQEAVDTSNPLLEKLKFLAITSSTKTFSDVSPYLPKN